MKLSDSRGPTIDTQKCLDQIGGNRFELVLIASVRSREISRRLKNSDQSNYLNASVSALLDVQEGIVTRQYLKKVD
jgi:DNA-directed RNA polymerase subunit K/omega